MLNSSQPNWANLFRQGRCKAVGVPWSQKELDAIYKDGVSVDDIRSGVWKPGITLADVSKNDNLEDLKMHEVRELYKEKFDDKLNNTVKKNDLIKALRTGVSITEMFVDSDDEPKEDATKEEESSEEEETKAVESSDGEHVEESPEAPDTEETSK